MCRDAGTVAILAPVAIEAIAVRYAATRLGCVTALCPDAGTPERLQVFLSRIHADVVIASPDTAVGITTTSAPVVLAMGAIPGVAIDLLAVANDSPTAPLRVHVGVDDTCVLVATGVSKASVRSVGAYDRLVDLGPTPGRRKLICTPLPYIAQTLVDTVLIGGGNWYCAEPLNPR